MCMYQYAQPIDNQPIQYKSYTVYLLRSCCSHQIWIWTTTPTCGCGRHWHWQCYFFAPRFQYRYNRFLCCCCFLLCIWYISVSYSILVLVQCTMPIFVLFSFHMHDAVVLVTNPFPLSLFHNGNGWAWVDPQTVLYREAQVDRYSTSCYSIRIVAGWLLIWCGLHAASSFFLLSVCVCLCCYFVLCATLFGAGKEKKAVNSSRAFWLDLKTKIISQSLVKFDTIAVFWSFVLLCCLVRQVHTTYVHVPIMHRRLLLAIPKRNNTGKCQRFRLKTERRCLEI